MVTFRDAIEILITGDGSKARSEFDKVGKSAETNLKKADASSKHLSDTLTKTGVAAVGTGLIIGAGLFKAAEAASEADLAHQKLLNTIHNSPALVHATTEAFDKQAEALEKTTVYSHVQTTTIQALLGQYKLTQSQIIQLTPLVEDFASKMGIDTVAAAKAVGKAIEGSGGGLQRYGIITGVTKKGTDNFNLTVQALRKTVGGFATQEGKTFSGQLQIAKNELKHVEEEIGAGAIPVIRQLAGIVGGATHGFLEMDKATGGTIGKIATYGAVALVAGGAVTALAGQTIKLATSMGVLTATEDGLAITTGGVIAGLAAGYVGVLAAMGEFSDSENKTQISTEKLMQAYKDAADQQNDYTNAINAGSMALKKEAGSELDAYLAKHSKEVEVLKAAGIGYDQYKSAVLGGGQAQDELNAKLDSHIRKLRDLSLGIHGGSEQQRIAARSELADAEQVRQSLGKTESSYGSAQKQAKAYADFTATRITAAHEKADQQIVKLNHHIQDGRESYRGYSQATQDAAEATGESGTVAGKTADDYYRLRVQVDAATEAMFHQGDAHDKLAKDILTLGDDTQSLKDDTKAFYAELKKSGANSDATHAAYRKIQEDQLQLSGDYRQNKQDAIDWAVSMTHGAKDASDAVKNHATDFVANLQKEANGLAPGSPLRTFLQQYIDGIKHGIPDKKTTKITVDTSQALTDTQLWLQDFNAQTQALGIKITGLTVGTKTPGHTQQFAEGGWVDAPPGRAVPAIVHGGEFVLSREMLRGTKAVGRGGGDSGTIIKIEHLHVHANDEQALVDSLKKYNRTRGAIPIKVNG